MPEPETALLLQNIDIVYDGVTAVRDASFEVRRGETYGLMGLNGAGKTSLIKIMLGLRTPERGGASIFGKPASNSKARTNLAYLPERFSPPWFLTGLEFIRFTLSLYGEHISEKQAMDAAEKIALDPAALKRKVQTYSKGMRQKAGLLATILSNRDLMILDEPMSGLDPLARALVKDMLHAQKKQGRTLLLSSHILSDMDEACDRVALLDRGAIKFIGTPAELKVRTGMDSLEKAFLHSIVKRQAA